MKKNHEIRIKVSVEELELIKRKADSVGMTMAAFLKFIAKNSTLKVVLE